MVGVAVNVTFVPAQIVVAEAPIVTDGVTVGVTVMVTVADVAVAGTAQGNEEVMTTVMTSLFASVAFWYVALFAPTLLPFSFH